MKPLRDTEGDSPLLRRAKALLEATPPLAESRERMLRVRRALDQRRGGVWVYLGRLPAAAMAALIVLFGASAFAAVRVVTAWQEARAEERALHEQAAQGAERGKRRAKWVRQAEPGAEVDEAAALPSPTPPPTPTGIPTPVPIPSPIPTPTPTPTEEASPTAAEKPDGPSESRARSRAPRRALRAAPSHVTHDSPEAIARATDSELVHRAAKALRSGRDPALAARLLEAHRARSPSGPLAEEALSLQIEALTALGSSRAADLAREYVARYPGGRYTRVAKRALRTASR
jgi:hypothetical protein